MPDVSVRPARADDAELLAGVQVGCWLAAYREVLPATALARITDSAAALAQRWLESAQSPPSARHRVLVACSGVVVVGAAALAPAQDPDLDGGRDAELLVMLVDPGQRRRGHGSRLLAAAVDHVRSDGFDRVVAWVDRPDDQLARLLAASGWGPDGAARSLDLDGDGAVVVQQVRWHTDVTQEQEQP